MLCPQGGEPWSKWDPLWSRQTYALPMQVSKILPRSSPRSHSFLCCIHPRPSTKLVEEAGASWLQELRWLCCGLGPVLPLWQASSWTCPPQIQLQAVVWGGLNYSTPAEKGTAAYAVSRGCPLRTWDPVMPPTTMCARQQSPLLPGSGPTVGGLIMSSDVSPTPTLYMLTKSAPPEPCPAVSKLTVGFRWWTHVPPYMH